MTRRPRALVIGGSLGGLFAANVLREICAWDVEVFERVENDLASRGAGIGVRTSFGITPSARRSSRSFARTQRASVTGR
jgi:2-polyprenyl-6-methoxyphenol hydroxylase-like FAD-dependent oxidoreductase